MKCGCYVKYEGQDHWQRPIENGITFCPLHSAAEEMLEFLQRVHAKALPCFGDCETERLIAKATRQP